MSQPSSDFDSGMPAGVFQDPGAHSDHEMLPPVPQTPMYRKQGFNIYTVMLISSFVFCTAAAIVLFIAIDKLN